MGVRLVPLRRGTGCDVNETITTFCGPEEFRLHIRTLLVMCRVCVRAVWDFGEGSMFVVISSILGACGRWCRAACGRRVLPRSVGVALDTPADVSRPEVP